MQKNKALAIVLLVLFVLVLLVVLASAVFCVGTVELVWYNTPNKCATITVEKVVKDSGMSNNQSIFTLDRQRYMQNIEQSDPYLKVLSYEVVWPNNIRIHLMEREEVYCIQDGDRYLILDEEFKVLREGLGEYQGGAVDCILIQGRSGVDTTGYNIGDFVPEQDFVDYVGLVDAFEASGMDLVGLKALIHDVEVVGDVLTMHTYLGVDIEILNSSYYTNTKVSAALGKLEDLEPNEYSKGSIYVFKNEQSLIEARYLA